MASSDKPTLGHHDAKILTQSESQQAQGENSKSRANPIVKPAVIEWGEIVERDHQEMASTQPAAHTPQASSSRPTSIEKGHKPVIGAPEEINTSKESDPAHKASTLQPQAKHIGRSENTFLEGKPAAAPTSVASVPGSRGKPFRLLKRIIPPPDNETVKEAFLRRHNRFRPPMTTPNEKPESKTKQATGRSTASRGIIRNSKGVGAGHDSYAQKHIKKDDASRLPNKSLSTQGVQKPRHKHAGKQKVDMASTGCQKTQAREAIVQKAIQSLPAASPQPKSVPCGSNNGRTNKKSSTLEPTPTVTVSSQRPSRILKRLIPPPENEILKGAALRRRKRFGESTIFDDQKPSGRAKPASRIPTSSYTADGKSAELEVGHVPGNSARSSKQGNVRSGCADKSSSTKGVRKPRNSYAGRQKGYANPSWPCRNSGRNTGGRAKYGRRGNNESSERGGGNHYFRRRIQEHDSGASTTDASVGNTSRRENMLTRPKKETSKGKRWRYFHRN